MLRRRIAVLGGINIDIKGIAGTNSKSPDSHTGKVHIAPGGVARNIAENLARLGLHVTLLGCAGSDAYGKSVVEQTQHAGVCVKHVLFGNTQTGVYLSLSNRDGSFHYAVNDTQSCADLVTPGYVRRHASVIRESSLVVIDLNLNPDTLNEVLAIANAAGKPVFTDVVSADKCRRFFEVKGQTAFLSVNRTEFHELFGNASPVTVYKKCKGKAGTVIVNKDKDGSEIFDVENRKHLSVPPLKVDVRDQNGAGDAFNAGFIYSLMKHGNELATAGRFGTFAAAFALRSTCTVPENLTEQNLNDEIKVYRNIG